MKFFSLLLIVLLFSGCASQTPAPVKDRSDSALTRVQKADAPVSKTLAKGYYIVKEGDTLYRIALDVGHDYRDLSRWNRLENPWIISPGQELRVEPPESEAQPVAVTQPVGIVPVIESRTLNGNTDSLKQEPKVGRLPYSDEAYTKAMQSVDVMPRVEIRVKQEPVVVAKAEGETVATVAKASGDGEWIWPASGNVVGQYSDTGNKGLDIAGKVGDPVFASASGKVVYGGSGLRGYGQMVIVKHSAMYLTAYAHNSKILVKEGQQVSQGQKIAEMGDSDANQVMLHFELRRQGKPVDPLKYLPSR